MKGGLWANKFDYKNGENRVCRQCGNQYHTMKPRWLCKQCVNEKQRPIEAAKRALKGVKDFYPYSTAGNGSEQRAHFTNIRQRHRKAWKGGREELTKHYDKVFEDIEKNGILEWIYDRRDDESLAELREKKASTIQKEYPNTKHFSGYEE